MNTRTCLVTKTKALPSALLRFTVVDGAVVFDTESKQDGRGGYIVPDVQVLEKLPRFAKKLAHFLRVPRVEVPEKALAQGRELIEQYNSNA